MPSLSHKSVIIWLRMWPRPALCAARSPLEIDLGHWFGTALNPAPNLGGNSSGHVRSDADMKKPWSVDSLGLFVACGRLRSPFWWAVQGRYFVRKLLIHHALEHLPPRCCP